MRKRLAKPAEQMFVEFAPAIPSHSTSTRSGDDLNLSPTVQAIAAAGIDNICTFNFDELLEEAFQIEGLEPDIATPNEGFTSRERGIRIFHPHGFLSRFHEAGDIETAKIVFSEDDYNALLPTPILGRTSHS